jgi:tetratricopeptide (TPR) repeat protein
MGRHDSSEDNKAFVQIQPADLTLNTAHPDADDTKNGKGANKNFWVGVLFGGLIGLALLVILMLPGQIGKPPAPDISNTQPSQAPEIPQGKQEPPPWQEAQLRKQRTAAQDVLEKLLDLQFQLEEVAVEQWAGEEFAQAMTLAGEGDELYRNREFEAALTAYETSLQQMEQLLARQEQALADIISTGNLKIAEGDSAGATSTFELALTIDPDNSLALKGLQRAGVVDQVQALLSQAAKLEESGEINEALATLQKVTRLDPEYATVGQSIARLRAVLDQSEFSRQMSAGYQALGRENYAAAISAFQAAVKLDPQAAEAREALKQAQNERNLFAINGHLEKAEKFREQEQWQQALNEYNQALKIDSNLLVVLQNREVTVARARLDSALQNAISQPQRLTSESIWQAAQVIYREAMAIDSPGPRLQGQISKLREQLKDAITPVMVTFSSDNLSEVTLYKIADLGRFSTRELELKPGDYVVVASREGYRDVRKEFTVAPQIKSLQLAIQCDEQI